MKTLFKNIIYICTVCAVLTVSGGMFVSCADLDVPSPTVRTDDDVFFSDQTALLYISRIYSQMPFDDFKWSPDRQYFDDWLVIPDANSGQCINRDSGRTFQREGNQRNSEWWGRAYELLRDANYLIEVFPNYEKNFSAERYQHYLGEAYFARAMVFANLAKRYGGAPIVTKVLNYPENTADELETPRATEAETWDQALADFNKAIELLNENSPVRGLANKNVALAYKSENMLFAGSVAKYNKQTGFGQKTNVRVIGFDPGTENTYAIKYFKEAYNAAREIMNKGKFSLYGATATDPATQFKNMVDMFFDASSPENIFIKEYSLNNIVHGYDCYAVPLQLRGGGYSCNAAPVLDFVEMYDLPDVERYPDGTLKTFDKPDKYDPTRKYILYDSPMDIFKNAEPRLRAYVCFPYDIMKGQLIEIRRGIYTGDVTNGIAPLLKRSGVEAYDVSPSPLYDDCDAWNGRGEFTSKVLYGCWNGTDNRTAVTISPPGKPTETINASGKSGPFRDALGANGGFTIRKWIVDSRPTSDTNEGRCVQHFVLQRYAEVLLNMAEAACELSLLGQGAPDGADMLSLAENAIRAIRSRAGAIVEKGLPLAFNEEGKMLIRKERQKELAYEHKNVWDIRRWRTQHSDPLNGSRLEDFAYYRGLYPFYAEKADKFFFDVRFEEHNYRYQFRELDYYLAIPSGEVSKSAVIDQQPHR